MSIKRERLEEIIREEYNKLFVDEDVVGDAVDIATDVAKGAVNKAKGPQTYLDPLADFEDLDAGFEEMVVTLQDIFDATKETNDVLATKLDLLIRLLDHGNDTMKDFIEDQEDDKKVSAKSKKTDVNESVLGTLFFGAPMIPTAMAATVLDEHDETLKLLFALRQKYDDNKFLTAILGSFIRLFEWKKGKIDKGKLKDLDAILKFLSYLGEYENAEVSAESKKRYRELGILARLLHKIIKPIKRFIKTAPRKVTLSIMKEITNSLTNGAKELTDLLNSEKGKKVLAELEALAKKAEENPNVTLVAMNDTAIRKAAAELAWFEDDPEDPQGTENPIQEAKHRSKLMTRTRLQQIIKEEVESVLFEDSGDEDLRRLETQAKSLFHRAKKKGTRALDQMISDYNIMVDYLGDRDKPIGPDEPRQIVDELFNKFETLFYDNMIRNLLRNLVGTPIDALKRVPKSEEVLKKIDTPVDDVYKIAGHAVKKADKEQIRSMIQKKSEESRGVRYSSTHQFMGAKQGESPEETVERLVGIRRQGIPGTITIYQDPETDEVFGYAEYNTF